MVEPLAELYLAYPSPASQEVSTDSPIPQQGGQRGLARVVVGGSVGVVVVVAAVTVAKGVSASGTMERYRTYEFE